MPNSKNVSVNRLNSKRATGSFPIEAHAGFRFNARTRAINQDPAELTVDYRNHYNPSGFHEHFPVGNERQAIDARAGAETSCLTRLIRFLLRLAGRTGVLA
jgi:hypothetical protein